MRLRAIVSGAMLAVSFSTALAAAPVDQSAFDRYWDGAVRSFEWRVPFEPEVEPIADLSKSGLEVSRISFATTTGRVYGVLSVPTDKTKAPYPLEIRLPIEGPGIITERCPLDRHRIVLNLSLYDYPVADHQDANRVLYDKILDEPPRYKAFLLGANQAVDWLLERPDVDSARVTAVGARQGAALALALAAINRRIVEIKGTDPKFMGTDPEKRGSVPRFQHLERLPEEERKFFDLNAFRARLRKYEAATGEIAHKGRRRSEDIPDVEAFSLDRFYYSSQPTIGYVAKGFAEATFSLVRLLTGERVLTVKGGPIGTIDCAEKGVRLEAGDYAFRADDGVKHTSVLFCVRELPETPIADEGSLRRYSWDQKLFAATFGPRADVPVFPVVLCDRTERPFGIRDVLNEHYERGETRAFTYDASEPLFGAEAILADPPASALTLYRIAYEAQYKMAILRQPGRTIEIVTDSAAFCRERYGEIKAKHPDCLLSVHLDSFARAAEFVRGCDVLEAAYPSSSYAPDPLPQLKNALDTTLTAAAGRPLVFWMGASVPARGKWRTADELRAAIVYSVMRGAAGFVFHLGHGCIPPRRTRMWDLMLASAAETSTWFEDWTTGGPLDAVVSADKGVEVSVRQTKKGALVLAVNRTDRERGFTVKTPAGPRTVTLPGCGSLVDYMDL